MRVGLAAVLSQCNSMSEAPRERLMQSLHRYLLRRGKGSAYRGDHCWGVWESRGGCGGEERRGRGGDLCTGSSSRAGYYIRSFRPRPLEL